MLRAKILGSTAAEWFGRPMRDIPEGDMWRWTACQLAASQFDVRGRRGR